MTSSSLSSVENANTAQQAWDALVALGLDVGGRDADLKQLIHTSLTTKYSDPSAVTFHGALQAATLEQFVRAFFATTQPYINMLKDILSMFEKACASTGPDSWRLGWDGEGIDELQHFRKWKDELVEKAGYIDCPALTWRNASDLTQLMGAAPSVSLQYRALREGNLRTTPAAVSDWVYNWWHSFPSSLPDLTPPSDAPVWMIDIWNCLQRAMSELEDRELDRQTCRSLALAKSHSHDKLDAFSVDTLCHLESDLWLLMLVVGYASLLEKPADQQAINANIADFFSSIPKASFLKSSTTEAMSAYLSLPIWGRRHEFYAAWIASQLLHACDGHDVTVHHENGKITLPFKETEVADIKVASGTVRLTAEKRIALPDGTKAKGKGRVGNVQPDFSFWSNGGAVDISPLVVEVKHYKKAARLPWMGVLEDYANAHPVAHVVLANYGPGGTALAGLPEELQARCKIIGDLRPGNREAIDSLRASVLLAVGAPVSATRTLLLADISGSTTLSQSNLRTLLRTLTTQWVANHVAAADVNDLAVLPVGEESINSISSQIKNAETRFNEIIDLHLSCFDQVIFITDDDGKRDIDAVRFNVTMQPISLTNVHVLCVSKLVRL